MWRVAALFWVFIAPVVAGVLVLAVLLTPALQAEARQVDRHGGDRRRRRRLPVAWVIAKSFAGKTA